MKQLWDKYNWIVLAGAIIFTAGGSAATMTNLKDRVEKLEAIPVALARIEQKLDDLKDAFSHPNRPR